MQRTPVSPTGSRAALVALVTLLSLVLSACGGQGVVTPGPTAAASAVSTQGPSAAPTATAGRASFAVPPAQTFLIDTDVAADDLVAIAFMLSAPSVTVVAITVSGTGEARCAGGVAVVLGLLEYLDAPDIPVACGLESPLAGDHAFPVAWRDAVDRGSGLELPPTDRQPVEGSAAELIKGMAGDHPGLSILTLGPLTNLGDALVQDPTLAGRLGPVSIMGGAVRVPGNIVGPGAPVGNTVAEWNVYVDPHALAVVVDSGTMPTLVSLDGTSQVPLTTEFARRAIDAASHPAGSVLAQLLNANPFMSSGASFLWDPFAAEVAAGYPVTTLQDGAIAVEEGEGADSGFTRPVSGASNIRYPAGADPTVAEDVLLAILNAP